MKERFGGSHSTSCLDGSVSLQLSSRIVSN
jgi:hypothetical protein